MFIVLSHGTSHFEIIHNHPMNVEQRQAAADPQIKPTNLGCESA